MFINKIDRNMNDVICVSLALIITNAQLNKTIDIFALNVSNTFLIATILMIMFMKILMFNIDLTIIQNNIDVVDTLVWCTNIVYVNLLFSILSFGSYIIYPLIDIRSAFLILCITIFLYAYIRDIISLYVNLNNNNTKTKDQ
jgi:hypothetical protein